MRALLAARLVLHHVWGHQSSVLGLVMQLDDCITLAHVDHMSVTDLYTFLRAAARCGRAGSRLCTL